MHIPGTHSFQYCTVQCCVGVLPTQPYKILYPYNGSECIRCNYPPCFTETQYPLSDSDCSAVPRVRRYVAHDHLTVKFWKLSPADRKSSVPTLSPIAPNRTVCLHCNLTGWLKNVWEAPHTFLSLSALTWRYFCIHERYSEKGFTWRVFFAHNVLGVNI